MGTVNDLAESEIHHLIFDVALKAAIASVVASVPFLAWPVVNPVFIFVVTKLTEKVYDRLKLFVAFTIIDFETEAARTAYENAVAELKQVLQGAPDAGTIQKARDDFKRTLAGLIRFPA